jgi:hypothetical protein
MIRRFRPFMGIKKKGGVDYSTFGVIYSIARQVNPDYTGSLIRIRRDSDSTEQDIGIVDGELDLATISSFCSETIGRIQTVYNQGTKGSGWDQIYLSGTRSIIYQSGAVETVNGKPAILGQTSNAYRAGGADKPIADSIMIKDKIISAVFETPTGTAFSAVFGEVALGVAGNNRKVVQMGTQTSRIIYGSLVTDFYNNGIAVLLQATQNQQRQYSYFEVDGRAALEGAYGYYNGVFQNKNTGRNFWNPDSTTVRVGLMTAQFVFLGRFQEVLYKETDGSVSGTDDLLDLVIAEQNDFYGIY